MTTDPQPFPCFQCGVRAPRKFLLAGRWLCRECVTPRRCPVCNQVIVANIWRFATNNSGSDDYALEQCLLWRCARHGEDGLQLHSYGPGAFPPAEILFALGEELRRRIERIDDADADDMAFERDLKE